MRKLTRVPGVAAAVLLCVLHAAADAPQSNVSARARKILADARTTVYQHKTEIDPARSQYLCDCSGLVGYILKQESPEHFRAVPKAKNHSRPTASDFHDFFMTVPCTPEKAGAGWQRLEKVAEARAGDLLVWRASDPIAKGASTGHIMVIDEAPKQTGENTWAVVIIDSTTKPHHEDTRKPSETGVGRGTVFVRTDDQGSPIAYSGRSPTGPFARHPMSIGRVLTPGGK